jgi:hypothetical protein
MITPSLGFRSDDDLGPMINRKRIEVETVGVDRDSDARYPAIVFVKNLLGKKQFVCLIQKKKDVLMNLQICQLFFFNTRHTVSSVSAGW